MLAERAVVRRLDGGCDVPIAAFAQFDGDGLWLRARVGATDGTSLLEAEARGADPEQLGEALRNAVSQGADLLRGEGMTTVVLTRPQADSEQQPSPGSPRAFKPGHAHYYHRSDTDCGQAPAPSLAMTPCIFISANAVRFGCRNGAPQVFPQ